MPLQIKVPAERIREWSLERLQHHKERLEEAEKSLKKACEAEPYIKSAFCFPDARKRRDHHWRMYSRFSLVNRWMMDGDHYLTIDEIDWLEMG
jgi:hypothetical protein